MLVLRVEWDTVDGQATGVLVATLDRPDKRNAIDMATLDGLRDSQAMAADARAVVITGTPPAFSAGADLHGVSEDSFRPRLYETLRAFTHLAVPVIAAVDGPALGAGLQLAVAADLRIATTTSRFGVPAARLGVVVDRWVVDRMIDAFGSSIARAMLLAAEVYDGERLHEAGAVHRLGDLRAALEWARSIAGLAPLSIAGHKLAFERTRAPAVDVAEAAASDAAVDAARDVANASDDTAEGALAFLEKRSPRFEGH